MGLFSVLSIGTRGLSASQLGMEVSGQNIANADVEGYSRKRLNLSADYRYDGRHGQMGFGVEVVNIERMRNIYLDQQIRRQTQEVGHYKEIDHTLETIENIFNEPGDTGLMNHIDNFFDSWENLASNPADMSARTMVKTNAKILNDVFHNITEELRNHRNTRNDEIQNRVETINKIASEIFNLNKEIAQVELTNQNANDSRDRRDMLLKQLSKYLDIQTIENDLGQITITTSGSILVSPVDISKLELTSTTYTSQDGANYQNVGIRFANTKRPLNPTSGQLKGLIDARDNYIPEYQTRLDDLANTLVQKVNEIHSNGFNLMGYNGINFFDPSSTGASDIKISASIEQDLMNIAAASAMQSQPATTNAITAGSINFGTIYQLTKDGISSTGSGDPDNARNIAQGSLYASIGSTNLIEGVDFSVNYVTGTIQMLHAGYDGNAISVDFDYQTGTYAGPGDNSNAISIAQLRHTATMQNDALGNPSSTFDQYYGSMIGHLGLGRQEAASNLETREYLVAQFETHQDSIAGVSLDEEMAELIKFQHTYQASARIISTANQMLDVLMNL